MKSLVTLAVIIGAVLTKTAIAWQPPPTCDGAKHPHWVDCQKSYSCSDPTDISKHTCNDITERFDPVTSTCTRDHSGTATCLSEQFTAQGVSETSNDMRYYRVGSGPECVIFNYDIKGFHNPFTKLICDLIASQGYQVILPDYFRGEYFDPRTMDFRQIGSFVAKHSNTTRLTEDIENKVLPYGATLKCSSYKTIGTCWGSYLVLRLSSYEKVKAGISMHPSHPGMLSGGGVNISEFLTSNVKCPQLYLVAGDDHASLKPDGLEKQVLGSKLKIIEFPLMRHGWTTRGNMSDPSGRAGTLKAMNDMMDFLKNTPPQFNAAYNLKVSPIVYLSISIMVCLGQIFL